MTKEVDQPTGVPDHPSVEEPQKLVEESHPHENNDGNKDDAPNQSHQPQQPRNDEFSHGQAMGRPHAVRGRLLSRDPEPVSVRYHFALVDEGVEPEYARNDCARDGERSELSARRNKVNIVFCIYLEKRAK